jgi:hypothetical protein
MIRRLLTAASVLSLLVCIVTASLWMLSYRRGVTVTYEPLLQPNSPDTDPPADKYVELSVTLSDGLLVAERRFVFEPYRVPRNWSFSYEPAFPINLRTHAGFMYDATTFKSDVVIACPCWAAVGLAAITALACAFRRSSRAKAFATCVVCGCDLRASTGRCPECGSPILAEATA